MRKNVYLILGIVMLFVVLGSGCTIIDTTDESTAPVADLSNDAIETATVEKPASIPVAPVDKVVEDQLTQLLNLNQWNQRILNQS